MKSSLFSIILLISINIHLYILKTLGWYFKKPTLIVFRISWYSADLWETRCQRLCLHAIILLITASIISTYGITIHASPNLV